MRIVLLRFTGHSAGAAVVISLRFSKDSICRNERGEKNSLVMTEAEVLKIMREHLEGLFPKVCPNCQRRYPTLKEYVQITERLEPSISFDGEAGRWRPLKPLGTFSYANCPCGNTLALSSNGMPLLQLWSLLNWARTETQARGISLRELLTHLRHEIIEEVLAEAERDAAHLERSRNEA